MAEVGTSKGVTRKIGYGIETTYGTTVPATIRVPFADEDLNFEFTAIEDTYNRGSSFAGEDEKGPLVAGGSNTIPWTYYPRHPLFEHFFGSYDAANNRYVFLDTLEGKGLTIITDKDFFDTDPYAVPPDAVDPGDTTPLWAWSGTKCGELAITSNNDGVELAPSFSIRDVNTQYTGQTRAALAGLLDDSRRLLHRHLVIDMGLNSAVFNPALHFCFASMSTTITRPYVTDQYTNCIDAVTGNQVPLEFLENDLIPGVGEFVLERLTGGNVQLFRWRNGFSTLHGRFTWSLPGSTAKKILTIPQFRLTQMPLSSSGVALPGSTIAFKIQAGTFTQTASTISGEGDPGPATSLTITTSWSKVVYPGTIITVSGLTAPDTAWNRSFKVLSNNAANNVLSLGPLDGEASLPTLTDFTAGAAITIRARLPVLILEEVA